MPIKNIHITGDLPIYEVYKATIDVDIPDGASQEDIIALVKQATTTACLAETVKWEYSTSLTDTPMCEIEVVYFVAEDDEGSETSIPCGTYYPYQPERSIVVQIDTEVGKN